MSLSEIDTSFMKKAPCKGCPPEWFFGHNGLLTKKGKAVCATCSFTEECLKAGLEFTRREQTNGERGSRSILIGVWGGKSEADLKKERRNKSQ